jgi:hypothetical protein
MTQSRRLSLIEAIANAAVGYALAVITQIVVFPWFGLNVSLSDNLTIGGIFIGISLLRSYVLRRLFSKLAPRKKGPAAAGPK